MNTMGLETEQNLLRKAGYSDFVIKTYMDLKKMPFKALEGQKIAEAFLFLVDVEMEKSKGRS